jgi:glycosyltransferase involved in cell wall biosynthesis
LKVLHVINNLGKGGAERLLVDALPKYKEQGIEVSLLQLSSKGSEADYIKMLNDHGVICQDLKSTNLYSPATAILLYRFLSKYSCDVIHVHLFPALYWVAIVSKFLRKKPILVFTEHNTRNKRSDQALLKPIEKWVYAHYRTIIAISEKVKESLESRNISNGRIALINNGVDTDLFSNAVPYTDDFWCKTYHLPENAVKVMMTARFRFPKDHITLINALKLLPENCFLILTGDGGNRVKIEEYVASQSLSDRVIFLGFRTDIPRLMKSVHVNVLSSEYEGMSGVTLEAFAAGKHFLGSDVPGINDIVPDREMLFEYRNATQLADAIQRLISLNMESADRLIQLGYDQANRFSMQKMVKSYSDLYKSLLSSN